MGHSKATIALTLASLWILQPSCIRKEQGWGVDQLNSGFAASLQAGDWKRVRASVHPDFMHDGFPAEWIRLWLTHLEKHCKESLRGSLIVSDTTQSENQLTWTQATEIHCKGPGGAAITILKHAPAEGVFSNWCRERGGEWLLCGNGKRAMGYNVAVRGAAEGRINVVLSERSMSIWTHQIPDPEAIEFLLFFGQNLFLPYLKPGDTWGGILESDGIPVGVETEVLPVPDNPADLHTLTRVVTAPSPLRIKTIERWWDGARNLVRARITEVGGATHDVTLRNPPPNGWLSDKLDPHTSWVYETDRGLLNLTVQRGSPQ